MMRHKDPCVHCQDYGGGAPILDSFCSQFVRFTGGAQWIGVCKNHLMAFLISTITTCNLDDEEKAEYLQILRQLGLDDLK